MARSSASTPAASAAARPLTIPGTTCRCWREKPGALRNGDPFRHWDLPPALTQIRRRLAGYDDGDRQFVDILTAVAEAGLDAVEAACAEALSARSTANVGSNWTLIPGPGSALIDTLINQARNLASLPYSSLAQLQQQITQTQQLLAQAQRMPTA